MNGKHPIDELFARHLRDAEAQPPPAVWEGIMRERGTGKRGLVKRRRWGLAGLLLLFLGGAGYWALPPKEGASGTVGETSPSVPRASSEQPVTIAPVEEPNAAAGSRSTQANGPETNAENAQPITTELGKPASSTRPNEKPAGTQTRPRVNDASGRDPKVEHVATTKKVVNPAVTIPDVENNEGPAVKGLTGTKETARGAEDPTVTSIPYSDKGAGDANPDASSPSLVVDGAVSPSLNHIPETSADEEQRGRSAPDVHLLKLNALVSPLSTSDVTALGPIMKGDSTPAYVLSKGHWWIALQGEATMLNGEWKGQGREVSGLNASETWRGGQSLSLIAGRDWLSGWSVGLGIGATRQRSRFLRRETEPSQTETVIDTTWTGTPMGAQTNYTWDIVQTQITEPGVEHDYSATNTYTKIRLAPEVGYQLLNRKRFSLHARFSPVLLMDLDRTGNTVVPENSPDSLETAINGTTVVALGAPSLRERFPLAIALSGALELRYRLFEHWSVSALPTYTQWMPKADAAVPSLSMNGLGGALRVRYDFRHNERRVK